MAASCKGPCHGYSEDLKAAMADRVTTGMEEMTRTGNLKSDWEVDKHPRQNFLYQYRAEDSSQKGS
jgi:hypothetical protein